MWLEHKGTKEERKVRDNEKTCKESSQIELIVEVYEVENAMY